MDDSQQNISIDQNNLPIIWTASEFVATTRSLVWNAAFAGLLLAVCGLLVVVVKDYFASVAVLLAGILYKIMTAKKPRTLEYSLDETGFYIDKKYYEFVQFKSFMIITAADVVGLEFMPIKKFGTEVMFFTPPDLAERIVALVGQRIPHDQTRTNTVDTLVNRFRI